MRSLLPRLMACAAILILAAGCANGPHAKAPGGAAALAPDDLKTGTNPNAPYSILESQPKLLTRSAVTTTDLAHAQPCLAAQLAVYEVAANVDGNRRSVTLGFVNRGSEACKVGGYPEIQLLDAHHQEMAGVMIEKVSAKTLIANVGPATQQASSVAPETAEVLLAPRAEADFQIGWTTGDGCPVISQILVAAPGTQHLISLNRRITVCEGPIQITAVHPSGTS
jgi:hypothetical protein